MKCATAWQCGLRGMQLERNMVLQTVFVGLGEKSGRSTHWSLWGVDAPALLSLASFALSVMLCAGQLTLVVVSCRYSSIWLGDGRGSAVATAQQLGSLHILVGCTSVSRDPGAPSAGSYPA